MKFWLIGGTIVGLLGVSFYLAAVKRCATTAAIAVAIEPQPEPLAGTPLALHDVVDVTDIDYLLDPDQLVKVRDVLPSGPPPVGPKRIAIAGTTDGGRVIVNSIPAVRVPILTSVGYEEVVPSAPLSRNVKPIPKSND